MLLSLQIRSVSKVLVNETVEWVSFLMEDGQVTVYGGHAPVMGQVLEGQVRYKTGKVEKSLEISKGFAHITNEKVVILV